MLLLILFIRYIKHYTFRVARQYILNICIFLSTELVQSFGLLCSNFYFFIGSRECETVILCLMWLQIIIKENRIVLLSYYVRKHKGLKKCGYVEQKAQ
jgi:hypothetical protein